MYAQPSSSFSASVVNMTSGLVGTIGVRVINASTGAVAVARSTAGITEPTAGSGTYVAQITAPSASGRYVVEWDTGSVSPTTTAAEDLVVSSSVGANGEAVLVGSTITYVGPLAASGAITLVVGDDYATADARQLKFIDTAGLWPTLTGATISLVVASSHQGPSAFTAVGSVVVGTGNSKEVDVPVTAAQSGALTPATYYQYALVATLTDASAVTLSRGTLAALGRPL